MITALVVVASCLLAGMSVSGASGKLGDADTLSPAVSFTPVPLVGQPYLFSALEVGGIVAGAFVLIVGTTIFWIVTRHRRYQREALAEAHGVGDSSQLANLEESMLTNEAGRIN